MRLTNDMRDHITRQAIEKAGFPARYKEHAKKMAAWAESCRVHALGGLATAKKIDGMAKRFKKAAEGLPQAVVDSPFRTDYNICMNIGGKRFYAQFSGYNDYQSRVHKITVPKCTVAASHELAKEFDELEHALEVLNDQKDSLRQIVRASVDSCTTVEKLLKVWPEARELLPTESTPAPKLPAIPVAELNARIGLPAE